jgi:aspartate/methionine/tyrosine aminotransferase
MRETEWTVGRGLELPIVDRLNTRIDELRASGRHIISLAQAVPGFPAPAAASKAAAAALSKPGVDHYTADAGLSVLRESIGSWLGDVAGARVSGSANLLVTSGANQAFMLAALTILQPGDTAILASPFFFNHEMALQAASVTPLEVECTWDEAGAAQLLARAVGGVRAVVVTTPSNPTGDVFSEATLRKLAEALRDRGVWLIVDETYLTFVYDRSPASATRLMDLGNVVVIGSFSKTFAMMGWRIGYLAAPERVVQEAIKAQDAMIICPSAIAQYALLGVLKDDPGYSTGFLPDMRVRRDYAASRLASMPGIEWTPTPGGFFAFVNVAGCTDSLAFSMRLLDEAGVATVPGRAFGRAGEGHVRLSYGSATMEGLSEALDRLSSFMTQFRLKAETT